MALLLTQAQLDAFGSERRRQGLAKLNRSLWGMRVPIEAMPVEGSQQLALRDGEERLSRLQWDGQRWCLTRGAHVAFSLSLDVFGRVRTAQLSDGVSLDYRYEGAHLREVLLGGRRELELQWTDDKLAQTMLADGRIRRFRRDARGRLACVELDGTPELVLEQDPRGRITAFSAGKRPGVKLSYGSCNIVSKLVDADGKTLHINYPEGGGPWSVEIDGEPCLAIQRNGTSTVAHWDDGSTQEFIELGGRLAVAKNDQTQVKRSFDHRGLLVGEYTTSSKAGGDMDQVVVRYGYDRSGALNSTSLGDRPLAQYTRDQAGRLAAIKAQDGSLFRCLYDGARSGITEILHPDGSSSRQERDALGRPELLMISSHSGEAMETRRYSYDAMHRIKELHAPHGDRCYAYDARGRLSTVGPRADDPAAHQDYSTDSAGNRQGHGDDSIDYTAANRLVRRGEEQFSYDRWGNVIERRTPRETWRMYYQARHQLVEVHRHTPSTCAGERSLVARYRYDAAGRRVRKETPSATTHFTWVGGQLVREETATNGGRISSREYLWMPEGNQLLAMWQDGKRYHVHCDHRHVPLCATDEHGRLVWHAEVSAFGETLLLVNEIDLPWRLAGQYYDEETGWHYNVARYYDPELGRYLSPDPLGIAGGSLNVYLYCDGDPMNRIDPLGLNMVNAMAVSGMQATTAQLARNAGAADFGSVLTQSLAGGAHSALMGAVGIRDPILNTMASAALTPITSGLVSGLLGQGGGLANLGAGAASVLGEVGRGAVAGVQAMGAAAADGFNMVADAVAGIADSISSAASEAVDAVGDFFGGASAAACANKETVWKDEKVGSDARVDEVIEQLDDLYTPYGYRERGELANSYIKADDESFNILLGRDDPDVAAFYSSEADSIIMRDVDLIPAYYAHEGGHFHTHPNFTEQVYDMGPGGLALDEGFTDWVAETVTYGKAADDLTHEWEEKVAQHVAAATGEEPLFSAYAGGDVAGLRSAYDAKTAPGSFDRLVSGSREYVGAIIGADPP